MTGTSENEVSVDELRAGDEFATVDGEQGRVMSPLGYGDGDLARLAIVTDSEPFVQHVDWGAGTKVVVLSRAQQPTPPNAEA